MFVLSILKLIFEALYNLILIAILFIVITLFYWLEFKKSFSGDIFLVNYILEKYDLQMTIGSISFEKDEQTDKYLFLFHNIVYYPDYSYNSHIKNKKNRITLDKLGIGVNWKQLLRQHYLIKLYIYNLNTSIIRVDSDQFIVMYYRDGINYSRYSKINKNVKKDNAASYANIYDKVMSYNWININIINSNIKYFDTYKKNSFNYNSNNFVFYIQNANIHHYKYGITSNINFQLRDQELGTLSSFSNIFFSKSKISYDVKFNIQSKRSMTYLLKLLDENLIINQMDDSNISVSGQLDSSDITHITNIIKIDFNNIDIQYKTLLKEPIRLKKLSSTVKINDQNISFNDVDMQFDNSLQIKNIDAAYDIKYIRGDYRYLLKDQSITTSNSVVQLGASKLNISSKLNFNTMNSSSISIKSYDKVKYKVLENYFPTNVLLGTRDWMASNIRDGYIDSSSTVITLSYNEDGKLHLDDLRTNLSISDVILTYLPTSPLIYSDHANINIGLDKLSVFAPSATTVQDKAKNVKIAVLYKDDIKVDVRLDWRTDDTNHMINYVMSEPLYLMPDNIYVNPNNSTGKGRGKMHLLYNITSHDVEDLDIKARIYDIDYFFKNSFNVRGYLDMYVTKDNVFAQVYGKHKDSLVTSKVRFAINRKPRYKFDISIFIDNIDIQELKLWYPNIVNQNIKPSGQVDANVNINSLGNDAKNITYLKVNLTAPKLDINLFTVQKQLNNKKASLTFEGILYPGYDIYMHSIKSKIGDDIDIDIKYNDDENHFNIKRLYIKNVLSASGVWDTNIASRDKLKLYFDYLSLYELNNYYKNNQLYMQNISKGGRKQNVRLNNNNENIFSKTLINDLNIELFAKHVVLLDTRESTNLHFDSFITQRGDIKNLSLSLNEVNDRYMLNYDSNLKKIYYNFSNISKFLSAAGYSNTFLEKGVSYGSLDVVYDKKNLYITGDIKINDIKIQSSIYSLIKISINAANSYIDIDKLVLQSNTYGGVLSGAIDLSSKDINLSGKVTPLWGVFNIMSQTPVFSSVFPYNRTLIPFTIYGKFSDINYSFLK